MEKSIFKIDSNFKSVQKRIFMVILGMIFHFPGGFASGSFYMAFDATISGILSAGSNFGIEAGKPMAEAAVLSGYNALFQNNVTFNFNDPCLRYTGRLWKLTYAINLFLIAIK